MLSPKGSRNPSANVRLLSSSRQQLGAFAQVLFGDGAKAFDESSWPSPRHLCQRVSCRFYLRRRRRRDREKARSSSSSFVHLQMRKRRGPYTYNKEQLKSVDTQDDVGALHAAPAAAAECGPDRSSNQTHWRLSYNSPHLSLTSQTYKDEGGVSSPC